jgi:hypothetical protein
MGYSFEQQENFSEFIFISSPRIFIRDYASTLLYSGQQMLAVSTPLSGWNDIGLISNIAIPVTRNLVKLQLGLPKTTRKSQELSREAQVTLTFHENHATTITNLIGGTAKNVLALGTIASQSNAGTAVSTLDDKYQAGRFVVGDKVCFWDASGDVLADAPALTSPEVVSAVSGTDVSITGTWGTPPEADDQLVAGIAAITAYTAGDPSVTVANGAEAFFKAGDRVSFITAAAIVADDLKTPMQAKTDRRYVTSVVDATNKVYLSSAFTGTPVATDLLFAYKSIEIIDPLGTISEKSLLVFFDWVVNSIQRQVAIWYPKVTVSGSWAPDFKNNENFMDSNMSFEVQSTTQVVSDGTSKLVLSIPFMFD